MANTSVFGIVATRDQASDVVEQLRAAGFRNTDVSVLYSGNIGNKDLTHEKKSKAGDGAAVGAASGAVVGGALGWLAGIGALAIPGIGPLIAAGPIVAALSGAGAVGSAGGIIGALAGSGIPEYEAKRYDGRVRSGEVLMSVHCDDGEWTERAKQILKIGGAQDISSTGESAADYARSERPELRHR